jgi:CRP-like cAMP-binding protein
LTIMKEIPILHTMSATIRQLAHYCEVLFYPPNSMILCEGDVCEYIYFIRYVFYLFFESTFNLASNG